MSQDSKIEWTHHTFNPWSGCTKVSAGCTFCYADALPPAMRRHAQWGDHPRVPAGEDYWRQPLAWNRAARRAGERHRVFCASVADVFEDRTELDPWRARLFELIAQTPDLDWLLLTKRPQVALRYSEQIKTASNVWLGTSVEDQRAADERIPVLLQIPTRVRFLSCEPLLGPVRLFGDIEKPGPAVTVESYSYPTDYGTGREHDANIQVGVDWVIVGGESGPKARPMHPEWARSLRDECVAAGVPFLFKQWGGWALKGVAPDVAITRAEDFGVLALDGDWYEGHTGWNGRAEDRDTGEAYVLRVGKKAAGRVLDGRTWDEVPDVG